MNKTADVLENIHRRKGMSRSELLKKAPVPYLLILLLDDLLRHVETHEALFGEIENTSLMRSCGVSNIFSKLHTSSLYFIANRICALFDPAFSRVRKKSDAKKPDTSYKSKQENLSIEQLIHLTESKVNKDSIAGLRKIQDKFNKLNARNVRNKLASHLDMETFRNPSLITGDPFDYQILVSLINECKSAIELIGHETGELSLEEKIYSNYRNEIRKSAGILFNKLKVK
ncbi:MAG: AbiU2 domain-containing protein [Limnobacter sp.]|uniref:AbiU2 domain-containing protein n=1 Tax=Limnobacter sp. TaxID=2003368 RepID=UPI004037D72E